MVPQTLVGASANGEELVALIEDGLGDQPPTSKLKVVDSQGGLRERVHQNRPHWATTPRRRRNASRVAPVLRLDCLRAGRGQFLQGLRALRQAMPAASRTLPQDASTSLAALGVIGAASWCLALRGAPCGLSVCRSGGWSFIGRHVLQGHRADCGNGSVLVDPPQACWRPTTERVPSATRRRVYFRGFWDMGSVRGRDLAQWTAAGVAAARRIDLARRVSTSRPVLAFTVAGACGHDSVYRALVGGRGQERAVVPFRETATGSNPHLQYSASVTMALMLIAVLHFRIRRD